MKHIEKYENSANNIIHGILRSTKAKQRIVSTDQMHQILKNFIHYSHSLFVIL
jgi:hypothetical protein